MIGRYQIINTTSTPTSLNDVYLSLFCKSKTGASLEKEKEVTKRIYTYTYTRQWLPQPGSGDACSVRVAAVAQVNKVKHLSCVNGNINTPRPLRLETSRAKDSDVASGRWCEPRSVRVSWVSGREREEQDGQKVRGSRWKRWTLTLEPH